MMFVLPAILAVLNLLAMAATAMDPKQRDQNSKATRMIFWIIPMTSLFLGALIYSSAFGHILHASSFASLFMGILFVVLGNYLPKCKQNLTLGIKLKWTLANEENWNATHRFGGKLWVAAGILFLFGVFLPVAVFLFICIPVLLLTLGATTLYSYLYYKKQLREGTATKESFKNKRYYPRWVPILTIVLVSLILAACLWVTFTGSISYRYDDTTFTVEASYYQDMSVAYADITAIEYREENISGYRLNGFGSAKLSLGHFENEEFGRYIRYTYTTPGACVIVTVGDKIVVLSGQNVEETHQLYRELTARIHP